MVLSHKLYEIILIFQLLLELTTIIKQKRGKVIYARYTPHQKEMQSRL